ncbi:hypothetical protein [Streptomyces sp. Ncost-T10-10d]|uniref:hypothetical protein n=1 Tax=Streptomyces sp. Ncost-T10-10d TaxID=1839774 RepID=UPI000B8519A4|nr:hypothetical protein [Streptomyces sp. Ncost-T10-10d]
MLCTVMAGILSLPGDWSSGTAVAPVVMTLAQWFWQRHRYWIAGGEPGVAGAIVAFLVVEAVRPGLRNPLAAPLGVAIGVTVSLAVFTIGSRWEAPPTAESRVHASVGPTEHGQADQPTS